MSNSFYYFFSATPQVLAGILALFGVFVIFKIQTIKSELMGVGLSILDESRKKLTNDPGTKLDSKSLSGYNTLGDLENAIQRGDIWKIKLVIESIDHSLFSYSKTFYIETSKYLQTLITRTLYLSIFTAFTIILCLAIIPFGSWILCHPQVLYVLFSFVLVCIIICFYGLITILINSLRETVISLLPKY